VQVKTASELTYNKLARFHAPLQLARVAWASNDAWEARDVAGGQLMA